MKNYKIFAFFEWNNFHLEDPLQPPTNFFINSVEKVCEKSQYSIIPKNERPWKGKAHSEDKALKSCNVDEKKNIIRLLFF